MTPFLPTGPLTSSFQKSIDRYLADTIPSGKTLVVLAVATEDRVSFGTAIRLGTGSGMSWKLAGGLDWDGDLSGQVVVMGSW